MKLMMNCGDNFCEKHTTVDTMDVHQGLYDGDWKLIFTGVYQGEEEVFCFVCPECSAKETN